MEKKNSVTQHIVSDEYDERARIYGNIDAVLDAGADAHVNTYYNYISKRWVSKFLKPGKQDIILDFGCGVGRLTQFLAPKVKHITGIDTSVEMIKLASKKNAPNASLYHFENDIPDMNGAVFTKLLFHWVLIHIDDENIHHYLDQLTRYTSANTECYVFEQTNLIQRTSPTHIHIHRTKEEYIKLFAAHGWTCTFTTRVWRIPSYGLWLINKYKKISALTMPVLAYIDDATLYRKPENIEYTTEVFIFSRVEKH